MGSSIARVYGLGVTFGILGAVISAPIYGTWPSLWRILVTHPVIAAMVASVGSRIPVQLLTKIGFRGPIGWGLYAGLLHATLVSALDIYCGATYVQAAMAMASGVLFTAYAFGMQEIIRMLPRSDNVWIDFASSYAIVASMYLGFGMTIRHTAMNW